MTIRCFRWDDAGAPQLGAASSLSVVLEKCLVDGYGTQAGLGWGKLKSPSGNVIAFQPQARAASRPWLAFDDRCGTSQYGADLSCAANVMLYERLTSLGDDGGSDSEAVLRTPTDRNMSGFIYRAKNARPLKWLIIADSEKDYFWILTESVARGCVGLFMLRAFGSLSSVNAGDVFGFVYTCDRIPVNPFWMDGEAWAGAQYVVNGLSFVGGANQGVLRQYGDHGGVNYAGDVTLLIAPVGVVNPGDAGLIELPNAVSNKLVVVDAGVTVISTASKVTSSIRGRLSGLFTFLNSNVRQAGVSQLSVLAQDIDGLGGRKLLVLEVVSPYCSDQSMNQGYGGNFLPNRAALLFDLTGPWL